MREELTQYCCDNWHKDFCDCVTAAMREDKKRKRDRSVKEILTFLDKNKIEYIQSHTTNVVVINPQSDNALLSLVKDGNLLKVKFENRFEWYRYSKNSFICRFKKK
jgi:hypothetical protein